MAGPSRVKELQPGDHACLTFSDAEERLDLVAAFVRDGLRQGQRVLCLTDSIPQTTLEAELTERGLPLNEETGAGRLHLATSQETYLAEGSFTASRMLDVVAEHIEQARLEGYQGLRIAGDMSWALRPVAGVEELMTYETQLGSLLAEGGSIAVCQYDRRSFDSVTLAGVAATHDLAVAAVTYHDDALLRICRQYMPSGLRVAGEIDYRGVEPLTRALTESLDLDEHVHVNLAQLTFIDAEAAGALLQAATSLAAGQRMTVRAQPLINKVLRTLGAEEITHLDLVVSHDE
ncbi:MEDS domain-containing protein [Micromonospora sp. NPDC049679]|uniref:MEDS domain-containing protein n=1 Tax=Micromonospora sp. NPDC049679 TaxID=3155920 RepID=UPI0033F30441